VERIADERINDRYWPPRGFPDGLYQDVLWEKAKFTYSFHIIATIV
jgi:hypothetical protein